MAKCYRYGLPSKHRKAPLPAGVENVVLFWGGMNCRDLYKSVLVGGNSTGVPDILLEQKQELSFMKRERMIWPYSPRCILKEDGHFVSTHNLEEVRMGPLPETFCGGGVTGPVYGVFIASPNWDKLEIPKYKTLLQWITDQNKVNVLASIFHGNPGEIYDWTGGVEKLRKLFNFLGEEFPRARLIAVSPTPTYDAGENGSYDSYKGTCLLWDMTLSQQKKKEWVFLDFGAELDRELFDKLVDAAVIKGDRRSMTTFFYPILVDTLAFLLQQSPLPLQGLDEVAKLILNETLATVLEKYNDTTRHHFKAPVFTNGAMYNDFRRRYRNMERYRENWVPVDVLFETVVWDWCHDTALSLLNRYHTVSREAPVRADHPSYFYQERRKTLLTKKAMEGLFAGVAAEEEAGPECSALLEVKKDEEEPYQEEKEPNVYLEEKEQPSQEEEGGAAGGKDLSDVFNEAMEEKEQPNHEEEAGAAGGEDLSDVFNEAMDEAELKKYISELPEDLFYDEANDTPLLPTVFDFQVIDEVPDETCESPLPDLAELFSIPKAAANETLAEEVVNTGMLLRSKRKLACVDDDADEKKKRIKF